MQMLKLAGHSRADQIQPAQGVGSHAAAMLLRSGVRRLRLVDFDQVHSRWGVQLYMECLLTATAAATHMWTTALLPRGQPSQPLRIQVTLSSLNRHAVATRADVGLPKATVLARHFEAIFPEASVEVSSNHSDPGCDLDPDVAALRRSQCMLSHADLPLSVTVPSLHRRS
jgi:hypothetical protein